MKKSIEEWRYYNSKGNLIKSKRSDLKHIIYEYDENNNMIHSVSATGTEVYN